MLWGKNRRSEKAGSHWESNPGHPLAWAASALPLSHDSQTTTNPHNPLYVQLSLPLFENLHILSSTMHMVSIFTHYAICEWHLVGAYVAVHLQYISLYSWSVSSVNHVTTVIWPTDWDKYNFKPNLTYEAMTTFTNLTQPVRFPELFKTL